MTSNPIQPNKSNPADAARTGAQDPNKQTNTPRTGDQSGGRDEGQRSFGASASGQGNREGGSETTRFLDAIEENVRNLRSAMSGSDREGATAGRTGQESRTTRGEDDKDASKSSRVL